MRDGDPLRIDLPPAVAAVLVALRQEGLYLAGSGAHPGGGITGAPAENAVRDLAASVGVGFAR